jgi:membrane associated rhomboid family serine protease
MFPLRDVHKPQKAPWLTRLFVAANVAVFGWQLVQWNLLRTLPEARLGVVPLCYVSPGSCGVQLPDGAERLWQPLIASLFLHGDPLHLAFNLLFLWVFGPGLEDRLGKLRFAALYLGGGLFASLSHVITHPFSQSPVIGASGAIAAVLGAYFILLPRSWILTYLPPIWVFPVPAPLFLVLWFGGQISGAFAAVTERLPGASHSDGASQIAWIAHLAGFLCGAAVGWSVKPWWKKRKTRR